MELMFLNKKRVIFWCASLLVIFLTAYFLYYFNFSSEYKMKQLKEPFVEDAEESLGGKTPMDAYYKFRKALKNGDKEKALQYIFINDREDYRKEFQNKEKVELYLDMPEDLKKRSEEKCSGEAFACQKRASYYYEYEVKGEYEEVDLGDGFKGVKKPGTYTHGINFLKNLKGKWQISDL